MTRKMPRDGARLFSGVHLVLACNREKKKFALFTLDGAATWIDNWDEGNDTLINQQIKKATKFSHLNIVSNDALHVQIYP